MDKPKLVATRAMVSLTRWTPLLLLLWSLQPMTVDTKRVVILSPPFSSHIKFHANIGQALLQLGHQVYLTVPDYLQEHRFLYTTDPELSVIQYALSQDYEELVMANLRDRFFQGLPQDTAGFVAASLAMCDEMLRSDALEQTIRDARPDLIVLDSIPVVTALVVLPYKLDTPFAMVGSVYDVVSARIPYSSAANPGQLSSFTDDMTFFQRLTSMFDPLMMMLFHPFMRADAASLYAPQRPYISNRELVARADLWLVDMDHVLDYPRPSLPNVKLIGGMGLSGPAHPLPPELQSFMDEASQGVAVVSFGSYVLGLPQHLSDKLFNVFGRLPMKVVFRSNLTSPDPDKVFTSRWLPQNDLLGHPSTKLFVSHCGNNGQYDALYHAVPLLCLPMFVDQPYNSVRIQKKGFGEALDLLASTEEELFSSMTRVAGETRFKLAISQAAMLLRHQLDASPRREAARWIDHVMQFGGESMRYAGQRVTWYQFLGLDLLLFVHGVGVFALFLVYLCVKVACSTCSCKSRKKKRD